MCGTDLEVRSGYFNYLLLAEFQHCRFIFIFSGLVELRAPLVRLILIF